MALPWEDYQNTTATEEPPKPWEQFSTPLEPSVGQIAQNAGRAAIETVKGFIPKSLGEVLGFVTPVVGAVQDIRREGATLKDVLFGKPINESTAQNFPETQIIPEAEKTPPFSEQRFRAGFDALVAHLHRMRSRLEALRPPYRWGSPPELQRARRQPPADSQPPEIPRGLE